MSIGKSSGTPHESPEPAETDAAPEPGSTPDSGAADEARPSIGRALREARAAAGLSVDQISQTTRVRAPIVQDIEQDDFSRCGGDVYARGHIRTIAAAVGIAPGPLLEQFAEERGGRPQPTPAAPLFEAERIRPERQRPNWTAAMVAAIVAVIGFVGFTMFTGDDEGSKRNLAQDDATPAPSAEPSKSPAKAAGPKPAPSESAVAAAPADKVTVKLVVVEDGRSWVSAKDHNGMKLFDGTLQQGDAKTFTDPQKIDLVLGNAGAIQLFVNGKEIKDEFGDGQVERLTYTKGDPEAG
ncbi:helix-turn-helix domain-containing protein [Streptomyces sp. NPDC060194]|uniref:helix-turn-helix domain-containing protein n=1 Tax=Streptomyces sp. NPDC060194 TaxID=3347069 RepID=UPI0036672839